VRAAALGVLIVALGALASTLSRPARSAADASCSYELADLKTFSDPRRYLVYVRPRPTTIIAINARPMPRPTPTRRSRGFERHVWRLYGQITDYRLGDDGAIHLILFDNGNYMRAALPAPRCVPLRARRRAAIVNARRLFETRCGPASPDWRKLGAVVALEGVGLWNRPRGQRGHARNYAELHPVTGIQFIAGCE
jgi:hypothetical protein